jgi:hypothetical protein
MMLPNLIWVTLHRGLWPSDACGHGLKAAALHHALVGDEIGWWQAMSDIAYRRPPLLSWIAQFLVPVGKLIDNLDLGLLLVPLIAQFVILLLVQRTLTFVFQSPGLALLGCLSMASAPVFIEVGKQLQTQPLQLLAVAWFLYIMAHAAKWNSLSTLLHLVAASAFAILTMLSTPAFCIVPGLAATYEVLKKRLSGIVFDRSQFPVLAVCLLLGLPALLWSYAHGGNALAFASHVYSFNWGVQVEDLSFPVKIAKWADFLRHGFFLLPTLVLVVALGLTSVWSWAMRRERTRKHEARVALLALLQVALLLVILASSQQQVFRYVLPFAGYVSVLVTWSVFQIDRKWATGAVAGVFLLQLAFVNASEFGLVHWDRKYGGTPLERGRDRRFDLIDGILEVVSDGSPATVILEMRALSLDGAQVSYVTARNPEYFDFFENIVTRRAPPVHNADTLPARTDDDAWRRLLELEPNYFVMPTAEIRRRHYQHVKEADSGQLVAERLSMELAERVAGSALFERVATTRHPELEIYRYRLAKDR